jgi:hypothetical protein
VNKWAGVYPPSASRWNRGMTRKRTVTDLDECRALWSFLGRTRYVSDFWEFRLCFHRHFQNRPHFLLLEDHRGILGMIPLCLLEKEDMFVFFPGETWHGKTWLERTPIYCREREALPKLLSACPPRTYLRYMEADKADEAVELELDEIGYLLHPPGVHFSLDEYHKRFSWKKLKAIKKEISTLLTPKSSWHVNRLPDYDTMVRLNLARFDEDSYFHDPRFREGFRDTVLWLHERGCLRMVSLEIGGKTAAVDLGAVLDDTYVVFLGGTHPAFPGVAKAMNMHHIEFAFERRLSRMDFLCGDFHWKKLWHLDPEPLFKFVSPPLKRELQPGHKVLGDKGVPLQDPRLGISAY